MTLPATESPRRLRKPAGSAVFDPKLVVILCDGCGNSIEAPRDSSAPLRGNEEFLEERGWDLRGYSAYCPACADTYPTCTRCEAATHPADLATPRGASEPPFCMSCAQDLDEGVDDTQEAA